MLVCMKQYKDDLLASCLHLLLSLPKEIVEKELDGLVPALQVLYIIQTTVLHFLPFLWQTIDLVFLVLTFCSFSNLPPSLLFLHTVLAPRSHLPTLLHSLSPSSHPSHSSSFICLAPSSSSFARSPTFSPSSFSIPSPFFLALFSSPYTSSLTPPPFPLILFYLSSSLFVFSFTSTSSSL